MKKLFITFALTLALIGQNLQGAETYKTLVVNATTVTYTVPAGELCHVMYAYLAGYSNNSLTATMSGTTFDLTGSWEASGKGVFAWGRSRNGGGVEPRSIVIAGPATITLTRVGNDDNFCTLRLIPTPNIGGVGQ